MIQSFVIFAGCLFGSLALGADETPRVAGEWKTSFGPVRLELQNSGEVKGKIVYSRLDIQGKVEGKTLALEYDQGKIHLNATWTFDPSGNAFTGSFQASNGNRGIWNGWRPDPSAASAKDADFSGLWLTDLGLMELARDGSRFKGRYALRGTSSIEGTAKGRHFDFKFKALGTGPGWFDLDETGTTLSGASRTDGMAPWYGWKGRKAAEYARHVPLIAGQILDGSTDNLLTYTVRAPEGYKSGEARKWPVVLILHGSDMNGRAYVNTIAETWPDIARDYILLGINGERPSNITKDALAFNYSYISYVGRSTFGGYPGTDRESPALVSEAMDELKNTYPVKSYFVGGHSQGGYLTYSLLMNSPEKIAGAFPISGEVIVQCEPSAYEDKIVKAAQRNVPLAIVHGKTDPNVSFDSATYASGLFLDAGWPAVRFFADDRAGHMFGLLPVNQAIRWLEALNSDSAPALLDFAERRLNEKSPRDATAAIRKARTLPLDAETKPRLEKLARTLNDQATPGAETYLAAIKANKDNQWADGFLSYRDDFEFVEAAAPVIAEFETSESHGRSPASLPARPSRRRLRQGPGSRRQILRLDLLPPGQEMGGRKEMNGRAG
jgi:predicted esterase